MKRVVIVFMVLTLALFLSSAAFAKAGPKSICLLMVGYDDVLHLVLKASGTATAQNGKVKTYVVTGNHHFGVTYSFPISGSAYVSPGTTTVHATISGTRVVGGEPATFVENVQWDYAATTDPVGTVVFRRIDDIVNPNQTYDLNLVDCTTDDIPY
jgi:hypothetical protein